MAHKVRIRFAVLGLTLLFWQSGVAPLAHAAVAHSPDQLVSVAHHAPPAQQALVPAAMPCHGHETNDATSMAIAADASAADDAHGVETATDAESTHTMDSVGEGMGCCQSADCQCACIHASLHAVTLPVPARVVPDHPSVLGGDLPELRARVVELFKPPI